PNGKADLLGIIMRLVVYLFLIYIPLLLIFGLSLKLDPFYYYIMGIENLATNWYRIKIPPFLILIAQFIRVILAYVCVSQLSQLYPICFIIAVSYLRMLIRRITQLKQDRRKISIVMNSYF